MAIKQSITFNTTPERVYKALISSAEFGNVTGAPAEISADEGGAFSCFGGQITGRHIELLPNKRIVQAWRASPWSDGIYSIVKFDISQSSSSTIVELEQAGFPEGGEEHLEGGWYKMYWEPLKAHFG
ncbi:MAG: SRPBCC domain-containing protein [Gammaproteobacteria bacterium]|nr:SRPBCC domain-containing protein [Gammaproteobacteria bacterium]